MKKILNEVITEDNVQRLGENIAIKALKTVVTHSNGRLDYLYKCLLFDVYKRNTPNHVFSDGYDFAQTAMLFLWEHKGKKLRDYYGKDGKGKDCNILYACYHAVGNEIGHYKRNVYTFQSLNDDKKNLEKIQTEIKEEDDYTVFDTIVEKMELTQGEIETLNCYMAGMTFVQIARFLNIDNSTVWKRRNRIQRKYEACYC